ncbi:hypothetical protein M8C21_023069, partial [Ambrosia artemisiifolia]
NHTAGFFTNGLPHKKEPITIKIPRRHGHGESKQSGSRTRGTSSHSNFPGLKEYTVDVRNNKVILRGNMKVFVVNAAIKSGLGFDVTLRDA